MNLISFVEDDQKLLDYDFLKYPVIVIQSKGTLLFFSQSHFPKARAHMQVPKSNMNADEQAKFDTTYMGFVRHVQSEIKKELLNLKARDIAPPKVKDKADLERLQDVEVFKQQPTISVPQMVRFMKKHCHPTQWESEKTIRKNRFGNGPNQMVNVSTCRKKKLAKFSDFLRCYDLFN